MEVSMGTKSRAGTRRSVLAIGNADTRLRLASAWRLAKRELLAALQGPSLFLMVTMACVVAAVTVKSYLDYVESNGTLVLADPLKAPLLFAVLTITGYLGLLATASMAAERERGTLEVLFYGPVDAPTFVGGKILGHLLTYVVAIVALIAFLALSSFLTGMPLSATTILLLAASVLPAVSMIALGLLLAAVVGRIRPALALMVLAIVLFVAIDTGDQFAAAQPTDSVLGSAAGLLSALASFTNWLSPFGYVWRAADGVTIGATADVLFDLGAALIYCALLTGLAVVALRAKGVQRWRE